MLSDEMASLSPGGFHQLAGVSWLQKIVNVFVLNAARAERGQQNKPSWEP